MSTLRKVFKPVFVPCTKATCAVSDITHVHEVRDIDKCFWPDDNVAVGIGYLRGNYVKLCRQHASESAEFYEFGKHDEARR